MFRIRNLVGVGIALVMLILMTSWASAQPAQQATVTPVATTTLASTPEATEEVTATTTSAPTATAVAPAVSPLATPIATPVGTPSTLPTTGGSDDGTAAFSLLLLAAGAVLLASVLGLAVSRRSR